jgi:outer membrane receptor protein involved in Fe transport
MPATAAAQDAAQGQDTGPKQAFKVQAQDLGKALTDLARQGNREIYFPSDLTRGKRARALSGAMTLDQALTRLLRGSGLVHRIDSSGAITVRSAEGNGPGADSGAEIASGGSASSRGDEVVSEGQEGIAEILVVGSRSQNVDIRRTEDDPQPYVVFGGEEVRQSGAMNLEDFLRRRLPMNSNGPTGASSQLSGPEFKESASNISSLNLRGLGAKQTLILVDGRRVPRVQTTEREFLQGDINGIPLSAIERVEILPTTAGGIYGGGAVGGVINIVRKRDYEALDVTLGYNGTFRGGGETFRIDLTGGFTFNKGRTRIGFSGAHSNSEPLYVGDNDLWRTGRSLLAANTTFSVPFSATTANIRTSSPTLTLKGSNASLGSNHTFVPVGYGGVTADGGAALIANAGQYNIELPNDRSGTKATLINNPRVRSANVSARHEFSNQIEAFLDFSLFDNLGRTETLGPITISLTPGHAGNPFNQSVSAVVAPTGLPSAPQSTRNTTITANGGLIAKIAKDWTTAAECGRGNTKTKNRSIFRNYDLTALSADVRSGAIDIFQNSTPVHFSQFIIDDPVIDKSNFETTTNYASARASGPLFQTSAGMAVLTALAERRVEYADPLRSDGAFFNYFYPERKQAVNSLYGELTIPLVAEKNAFPMVYGLELQGAVRHDRYITRSRDIVFLAGPDGEVPSVDELDVYENKANATSYTLAASWLPIRDIRFRGSFSTGFLPPSVE